jgi:hypothetical protein
MAGRLRSTKRVRVKSDLAGADVVATVADAVAAADVAAEAADAADTETDTKFFDNRHGESNRRGLLITNHLHGSESFSWLAIRSC